MTDDDQRTAEEEARFGRLLDAATDAIKASPDYSGDLRYVVFLDTDEFGAAVFSVRDEGDSSAAHAARIVTDVVGHLNAIVPGRILLGTVMEGARQPERMHD